MKTTDLKQNINVIILTSGLDFGRCPLASKLPPALWPIEDKPVLEHLLNNLSQQGIKKAVICSNGDSQYFKEALAGFDSMDLRLLDEPLPVGTAGCIRDAASGDENEIFLVLNATAILPPDIDILMQIHQTGKSDLTIIFNSACNADRTVVNESEIHVCNTSVLDYIPEHGYFDIKEGLVPSLTGAGRSVYTANLPEPTGSFRNRTGYLNAAGLYLQSKKKGRQDSFVAQTAKVDRGVVMYGSVVVMDNADISSGTVILGPSIIGRNVTIGNNTLVANSVLWDGAKLGSNCQIRNCLVDRDLAVRPNTDVGNAVLTNKSSWKFKGRIEKVVSLIADKAEPLKSWFRNILVGKFPALARLGNFRPFFLKLSVMAVLFVIFLWSYWPEITDLWGVWQSSDEYSSGILVPFLMVYILWAKRKQIAQCPIQYSIWGLFAFVGAQLLRYFGLFFMYSSAERLSLILSIASLTLLLFGWKLFSKIAMVFVFALLMLPLPRSVHTAVMLPLQNLATVSAVFCLEALGYMVTRQGNVICINNTTIAVAEACNGLRMVTSFFVIVGLMMFLVRRKWWEKLILLLSALPIAIMCNTIRLTVTAIFFTMFYSNKLEEFFHTFGGYAMMPLALGIVVLELWLLTRLTQAPADQKNQMVIRRPEFV